MKKAALFGFTVIGAVALVVILANYSVSRDGLKLGPRSAEACSKKGTSECLPEIAFVDTSDTVWTADELAGKVVVVNFWATWCNPCRHEIPAFSAMYRKHEDKGVVFLGVLMDEPAAGELAEFSRSHHLDYPVVRVNQEILDAFEWPEALPTTFIYDRTGARRVLHRGVLSEAQLDEVLGELLAQ